MTAIALLYVAAILVLRRPTWTARIVAVLMLPPILLDVLANLLILRKSWRHTISAEAGSRTERPWPKARRLIDALFGAGHCQKQAQREAQFGSVWAAWGATWKALP